MQGWKLRVRVYHTELCPRQTLQSGLEFVSWKEDDIFQDSRREGFEDKKKCIPQQDD